nr:copia protein [Tanacetum cinerariifolium]
MAQPTARNHEQRGNHKHYASMSLPNPQKHMVPAAVLTQSKIVPINAVRPVSTDVPKLSVTRPRQAKIVVTMPNSPHRRHIDRSPSPKASTFPPKVTVVKAPMVNTAQVVQGKWEWKPKCPILDLVSRNTSASMTLKKFDYNDALGRSKSDKGVIDSGCSRHMTGNMSYLSDFEELNGGYVAFGGNPKGGKISRKGKITTGKLDFDDVYFVKELKFNIFSVSQMCDKKNSVLFTDTEYLVLSPEFKLPDKNQVLLRVPRENNMYNVNLKNIVPSGDLTCLFAKVTLDESNLWHRRLGHINLKNMNKLVKGLENHLSLKVKIIRSDNRTEYKNHDLNQFCRIKGIKREFSVPRTPQQNGIAERKNKTLIKAARTMLADLLLPISFWAEAANTACYVQNRVLVTKPQNKTPYELLHGRIPSIGFMRPFGCPVTILNTPDSLGKFNRKVDERFLVGYSVSSKAFRVFNSRTRLVQETLHIIFLENKPNVAGSGPTWLFDIDTLTKTMSYQPVTAGNQSNLSACVQEQFDAEKAGEENDPTIYAAFDEKVPEFEGRKPESKVNVSSSSSAQSQKHDDKTNREAKVKSPVESLTGYRNLSAEFEDFSDNSINEDNAAGALVPAIGQLSPNSTNTFSAAGPSNAVVSPTHGKSSCIDTSQYPDDPNMPEFEDITYSDDEDDVGAEVDFNNLETSITVSLIPTTRVHKDHHVTQISSDLSLATQTRSMTRVAKDQGGLSQINNDDFHTCMFSCFLSQEEPKREDGIDYEEVFAPVARIEAIRLFLAYASFMGFMVYQIDVKSDFLYETIEEEVYVCQPLGFKDPDYPDKVYKVVKVLYGLHQAPRAWKKDDILLVQIYVDDIIFGSTNKDLCKAFEKLMKDKFQMSSIGELTFFLGLQVKQKKDRIFISQDKYVAEILRKFGLIDGKSASTLIDSEKPLLKDPNGEDVDIHTYRSMIGSLMYLTSPKLDIMFVVCACAHFQVTPKASHLHAVKRIFRYLKGVNIPRCDEDRLELMELMVFLLPSDEKVRVEFWTSVAMKKTNDVMRLQALLDKKKVIITESTIRDALRLDDVEGIECLPNEKIFTELARICYKKPSTKLTFYKAFFSSHVAAEGVVSVVDDVVPTADEEPSIPSPTPPTPPPQSSQDQPSTSQDAGLPMDLLQNLMDTCTTLTRRVEHLELDKIAQALNITKLKQRVKKLERRNKLKEGIITNIDADEDVVLEDAKDVVVEKSDDVEDNADIHGRKAESQAEIYKIDLEHAKKIITEVFTAASDIITAASTTITAADVLITAATIVAAPTLTAALSRRRKGVVIKDHEETTTSSTIIHNEANSKDKGKGILVKEPKHLKKQAQIKQDEKYARELKADLNKNIDWDETEAQARKNMMIYLRNVAGFKMNYFKGMTCDDTSPIFEKHFDSNVAFLQKTKEQMDEEDSKALKMLNVSQEDKALKKQKLDEEVEELKRHLQIVPNDDDDVLTKATPLASKVPVVDYEIYNENNKPYYRIKRADGTHQLYLSFLSLLRNFDKEDMETLWRLVKERFATTKPKNFSDDFLLTTLEAMFEKPDVQAQI